MQGWGWDDFYNRNVGQYIQEGLPNVTGSIHGCGEKDIWGSGALYAGGSEWGSNGTDYDNATIYFDASRCSFIYGNSTTVQPRSYIVYYIMKVK